jgi:VIT1/CCC1 family predicted Fe2+/Mn2+ transporter
MQHARVARDPHHADSPIKDLILGGQDGLVNVLGVILGVAAATDSARIVLAAGLAAALAESISMAAVAYTSTRAAAALYASEVARERRHIARAPELERDEIRELYRAKGFTGELLDRVVERITSDEEVWIAVMLAEELKLAPVHPRAALRSAFIVGAAALVGSLIPLAPYLLAGPRFASALAVSIAGVTLFAAGAYKALLTVGRWWASGIEMTLIGLASAAAGSAVGFLFR